MLASMRRPAHPGKTWFLALACLASAGVATARTVQLDVARVQSAAGSMRDVEVRVTWPEGADTGELQLRAARVEVPAIAHAEDDVQWTCPLARDGDTWRCDGELASRGRKRGTLALQASGQGLDARLALGSPVIALSTSRAPGRLHLDLARVPAAWLQAYLAGFWADGQWREGRVTGRVDIGLGEGTDVASELALEDIALETPEGWLAGAGLSGQLSLTVDSEGADTRVRARLSTRGGEFLVGDLYAALPASPVHVEVEARSRRDGAWSLPRLSWDDAGVLRATGQAELDAQGAWRTLAMDLVLPDLAQARDRYLSGFLAPAGFGDLVLAGGLEARFELAQGQASAFSARALDLNAIDPRQRFTLAGLSGGLRWHAGEDAVASAIGWRNAALFGIGLGPVRFDLRSARRELVLHSPVAMDVLSGRLALDHLRWQAAGPGQGARFQLGVSLDALDLGSLSQRLGWPPFTGELGGRLPEARYADGVLRLDGGLAMRLFDGRIELSDLVMERPFGIAPTLSADVVIEDIDMEPMTAAFGFGAITGRLDGRIAGLRMVDWSPVAFDARLRSDDAWKGKRRISQRAVEDISRVGGGGLMAGLQAQVLKLFDDFGYARLGLACRLRDNVCQMDGVGSAGDGYTIVEGAGLPRIQVVGFRRQVDWPTLVDRLKAATEGQAPVIN